MRVLIVNTLFAPHAFGGAEESLRVLAEALVGRGEEIAVVSIAPRPMPMTELNGVRSYYVPLRNLFWPFDGRDRSGAMKAAFKMRDLINPAMVRGVETILDLEMPEVVHSNNLNGFSVGVWRCIQARRIPIVHTVRDYSLLCPRTTMFKGGRDCRSLCTGCAAFSINKRVQSRRVAAVVGNSAAVLDRHLANGYFSNVSSRHVIHSGCEIVATSSRQQDGSLRFGYLGRLSEEKGIEELCRAFAALQDEASLAVAGRGSPAYEEELHAEFASSRLSFLGYRERRAFLRDIDVLVVPSLWPEPLARVVFEAYAHGVPVIVANTGGLPEAVEEGVTGLVYDAASPDTLRQALHRIVRDPDLVDRLRSGVAAAAPSFSPSHAAARYASVYSDVVGGSRTAKGSTRQGAAAAAGGFASREITDGIPQPTAGAAGSGSRGA